MADEEAALEAQWKGICDALDKFLRGETTDVVFVMQRLHPVTMQRLCDTYELEVSEWTGFHMIERTRANPCLLKCTCPNK